MKSMVGENKSQATEIKKLRAEIAKLEKQLAKFKAMDPAKVLEKAVDVKIKGFAAAHYLRADAIKKVGQNVYRIGTKRVKLDIKDDTLVIRVGGGFMDLDEFVEKHQHMLRDFICDDDAIEDVSADAMCAQDFAKKLHNNTAV